MYITHDYIRPTIVDVFVDNGRYFAKHKNPNGLNGTFFQLRQVFFNLIIFFLFLWTADGIFKCKINKYILGK